MALQRRSWVPPASDELVARIAGRVAAGSPDDADEWLHELVDRNTRIHDRDCVNLDPAANVMSPRAEALLARGLGSRPSLGHPGDKYETGLEAIEQIEVIAAELAADVFRADYAEVRVASGAMANLYAFLACAGPGDPIVAPPAAIGGHVTHHAAGAAGLRGLEVHPAPVDHSRYTVDVAGLRELARRVRPRLITLGGSLNLRHHPVAAVRDVADEVGARVLFDAAHLAGLIAGGAWPNPLDDGAHLMTMSTYKSLAGPPSGLVATNDAALAERIDAIAFPGLTANFDVAKTAALALTLIDWQRFGSEHASAMVGVARALARHLADRGVPVVGADTAHDDGAELTDSHAFALDARGHGGGSAGAHHLRRANLLTSAIGLPGDGPGGGGGIRIGVNEMVRRGMTTADVADLADLVVRGLVSPRPERVAGEVTAFRRRFAGVRFAG
jgi:glycine hydroxymethyltransferase